jgi:hypothetical protein
MYTTYHLDSAEDLTPEILESIKLAFKAKPITIIVEESYVTNLTEEQKSVLNERLNEDTDSYIPADQVISNLSQRYGI